MFKNIFKSSFNESSGGQIIWSCQYVIPNEEIKDSILKNLSLYFGFFFVLLPLAYLNGGYVYVIGTTVIFTFGAKVFVSRTVKKYDLRKCTKLQIDNSSFLDRYSKGSLLSSYLGMISSGLIFAFISNELLKDRSWKMVNIINFELSSKYFAVAGIFFFLGLFLLDLFSNIKRINRQ